MTSEIEPTSRPSNASREKKNEASKLERSDGCEEQGRQGAAIYSRASSRAPRGRNRGRTALPPVVSARINFVRVTKLSVHAGGEPVDWTKPHPGP